MRYIFDTSSFFELERFYPDIFKSVWIKLDKLVNDRLLFSTREVWNEMDRGDLSPHLHKWIEEKGRENIFSIPEAEELIFVQKILSVKHFQNLIGTRQILSGRPVADPFVVACAKIKCETVVTEERNQPNAAKIPNVCEYFDIPCVNLEKFMIEQGWEF